jgi:hypothetical protein
MCGIYAVVYCSRYVYMERVKGNRSLLLNSLKTAGKIMGIMGSNPSSVTNRLSEHEFPAFSSVKQRW